MPMMTPRAPLFARSKALNWSSPCRISPSNIPPISTRASTWLTWWKSFARRRSRPASFRAAASASARCEHYAIGTGNPDFTFLDMVLRLGEGRDLQTRKAAGEHIFGALSAYLDPIFANGKFALSFDMQINDKETSWKRNNIHEALKTEAAHG